MSSPALVEYIHRGFSSGVPAPCDWDDDREGREMARRSVRWALGVTDPVRGTGGGARDDAMVAVIGCAPALRTRARSGPS